MPRVVARELMDEPVDRLDELAENLRDVERANRWFRAAAGVTRFVRETAATTVLDVGCGSADIPIALARDARRRGISLRITCLDRSSQMLEIARARAAGQAGLEFVEADGERLPFDDGAFDVVMCNLALHHFEPAAAVRLLSELRRVSAISPLVCDLRRSPIAYVGALAFAGLTTRNRLTRHDAPLSVRRAYTPHEALALADAAQWRAPVVRLQPFFRMALHDR